MRAYQPWPEIPSDRPAEAALRSARLVPIVQFLPQLLPPRQIMGAQVSSAEGVLAGGDRLAVLKRYAYRTSDGDVSVTEGTAGTTVVTITQFFRPFGRS